MRRKPHQELMLDWAERTLAKVRVGQPFKAWDVSFKCELVRSAKPPTKWSLVLWATFSAPDAVDLQGGVRSWETGRRLIPLSGQVGDLNVTVVRVAYGILHQLLQHEAAEAFMYGTTAPFDPHAKVRP